MNQDVLDALTDTIKKMIEYGFRFTVVHNSSDKRATIISVVDVDRIKNKFLDFNIYLNAHQQKTVEKVFYYAD